MRRRGEDPLALLPSDPLWWRCYRLPRGRWVQLAAEELRRRHPGERLSSIERIDEVIALAEAIREATLPAWADRR